MKTNIDSHVHFAIFDKNDSVAEGFVGLRRYPSDLFILFITSDLFQEYKEKIDNALESLKILIPDLKVERHSLKLRDYWSVFFKAQEIAKELSEHNKDSQFYVNITTSNRIAAMAVRDALSTIERPGKCYYLIRGKGEEERSELIEVPVPPFSKEMTKSIPILKSLYKKDGRAESIEELAKDIGREMSQSDNLESQAKLVEYYVRKLEVYAVVTTNPGKKREVILTGAPLVMTREIMRGR